MTARVCGPQCEVNAEQASKRTMCRPTRSTLSGKADTAERDERRLRPAAAPGYWRQHVHEGKRTQHGKPRDVVRDDQPDAREGQAGRRGVAERFVVPLKPGNAGGGKGPQFKTDARRGEGPGDWATYQLRTVFRNCRRRSRQGNRVKEVGDKRGSAESMPPLICLRGTAMDTRRHRIGRHSRRRWGS